MNEKGLSTNATTMLTGANTLGLVALLAYTVRNMNEMSQYLDEIKEELKTLKHSYVDNTKRTHAAISKISEKVAMAESRKPKMAPSAPEPKIIEVEEEDLGSRVDDVTAAIDELMKRR